MVVMEVVNTRVEAAAWGREGKRYIAGMRDDPGSKTRLQKYELLLGTHADNAAWLALALASRARSTSSPLIKRRISSCVFRNASSCRRNKIFTGWYALSTRVFGGQRAVCGACVDLST